MAFTAQQDPSTPTVHGGRRMTLMLLAVGLFLGLIVAFNLFKGMMIRRATSGQGELPQTVSVAEATLQEWQPSLSAVGTVRAVRGADLAFEVAGVVVALPAKAGSEVQPGQPLAALDDRAEVAQLRQLQAAAGLAEVTRRRAQEQLAAQAISQADFDGAEADFQAKQAGVQAMAAQVAKKHLAAPFPGRVGIVTTSPGAYLTPGAPVVTLQQLDQVYVDFTLPQREAARLKPGLAVTLAVDAYPGRSFTGKVSAVNPRVDSSTRNLQVEASFGNPGRSLLPGMFARVSLDEGARQSFLTLPQAAITYNPYGAVVFIARKGEAGLVAQQVFVTPGATRGDQVAIVKGLAPGAQVVTSGGLKLRNGTPLRVDNQVQPASDANPAPQEQ